MSKEINRFLYQIRTLLGMTGVVLFLLTAAVSIHMESLGLSITAIIVIIIALVVGITLFYRRLNRLVSSVSAYHDTKEQLLAEVKQQASQSKEMFQAITEQTTEGISVADLDGNYTFVNEAFCNMMGYSEAELLKLTVFDMKAPEQDTSSFERTKNTKEGRSVEVLLQRKDGSTFISEVIGKKINIAGELQVLGIVRDISEHVKAEEKIRTLYQAVEQSPIAVVIVGLNGNIKYINKTVEKVTGFQLEELKTQSLLDLAPESDWKEYNHLLNNVMKNGETWEGEFSFQSKVGATHSGYAYFSPVTDDYDQVIHYLLIKEMPKPCK